ncbi:MAG: FAD-binding oxidoreductase [Candidatus Helarchaeota archaeon]|nr:FAD-binding oxidoreductase [Candidatus Helarchaeota archaeon]
MDKEEIYEKLVEICGDDDVSIDEADLVATGDWIAKGLEALYKDINFNAGFLVTPKNKDEIIQIVKFANVNKIPIIPRAANTSLGGQVLPIKENTIMMDFGRHMNKILEINLEEEYVAVEPGVEFWYLQETLAKDGYFFPAEPGSAFACMIGGMVGNNASGASSFRFGTTRDYVRGLEIVLADGSVIHTGHKRNEKSVAGYDLTSLFVGSEGTLGIYTEIYLKIQKLPKNEVSLVVAFMNIDDAYKAIEVIRDLDVDLALLEYVDPMTIEGMNANLKFRFKQGILKKKIKVPKREGTILIRLIGSQYKEDLQKVQEAMNNAEIFGEKIPKVRVMEESFDQKHLWDARHYAGPGIARTMDPPSIPRMFIPAVLDIAVPPSKIIDFLKKAKAISQEYSVIPITMGHIFDGNVHLISAQNVTEENLAKIKEYQEKILDVVYSLGGTITAEHGVGLWKQHFLEKEYGTATMDVMKKIKQTLDPNNIMNPSKMGVGEIPSIVNFEGLGETR